MFQNGEKVSSGSWSDDPFVSNFCAVAEKQAPMKFILSVCLFFEARIIVECKRSTYTLSLLGWVCIEDVFFYLYISIYIWPDFHVCYTSHSGKSSGTHGTCGLHDSSESIIQDIWNILLQGKGSTCENATHFIQPINPGGIAILGQDQDNLGGGFDR